MLQHSIFLKITLFFLTALIAMAVGFFAIHQELVREHEHRLQREAEQLLLHLSESVPLSPPMRRSFLKSRGYTLADPHPDLVRTLRNAFTAIPVYYPEAVRDSLAEGRIRILKDDHHLYVYLTKATPPLLVIKADIARKPLWPEAVFAALIGSMLLLYLLIVNTLFPLTTLIRTIQRYGREGTYLPIKTSRKDEIAIVANALDDAMSKNQKLKEARQLFLRNIMHELKTPITAGKLALPFLEEGEEKAILQRAFLRMQYLIGEVVRVEQITSGTLAPNLRPCRPKELVEKASALLFLSPEAITGHYDETEIYADCDVFVSVFKNLIDNALKYSPDHTVRINQTGHRIVFSNRGEPWPQWCTFESLSEPFYHPQSDPNSFGLGLYIIKSVMDSHGFAINYRYESGEHRFELMCQRDPKERD